MSRQPAHDIRAIAGEFDLLGEFLGAEPYGSGHINDTYRLTFQQAGVPVRYILQWINHKIFRNPGALMENVQRVTGHLAAKVKGQIDASRRVLTLVPTRSGRGWHVDSDGNHWRVYLFIEKGRTFDAVESPGQAFTHNDTKFNNVILDEATGEGLCVIDLDTVMPGLALYDFGDRCWSSRRCEGRWPVGTT